jgi:hypothetical protein
VLHHPLLLPPNMASDLPGHKLPAAAGPEKSPALQRVTRSNGLLT